MFRISRRLDYGMQLLVALASQPDNRPQSTAALAETLKVPLPFLHQIGHSLMQAGLIKASPGPHGGIRLNRAPAAITMLQIVEILEGPISMHPCQECSLDCNRQGVCTSNFVWDQLENKVVEHLAGITLSALVESVQVIPFYAAQSKRQEAELAF
jgi:Rrf2 family protein